MTIGKIGTTETGMHEVMIDACRYIGDLSYVRRIRAWAIIAHVMGK